MIRWSIVAILGRALLPSDLAAQLGEVHLGGIVSYGTSASWRGGAGLIVGVAAARLIYIGARWTYYVGSSGAQTDAGGGGTFHVQDQSQVFAADVALQYPAGAVELDGGVTIGVTRYAQQTDPMPTGTGPSQSAAKAEFLVAPNLAVQLRLARLVVIPEVMYALSGSPTLRWPVDHRGPVFSVRLVVPIEVQRIRR